MRVEELVQWLHESGTEFDYIGNDNFEISSFSTPQKIVNNSIIWIKEKKFFNPEKFIDKKNILIVTSDSIELIEGLGLLICNRSKSVFFSILEEYFSEKKEVNTSPNAIVLSKSVGKNVTIGNFSYVGPNVTIGDNVIIGNNVSIENRVVIGNNTIIHSGTIIGVDGFGYFKDPNSNNMHVPHFGGVVIGENVEIYPNCCINRGTLDDTVIGDYVKIDALVQIPHNAVIGDNCLITGMSGMGGSCVIGEQSYIAPFSFVKNQVRVGKNCMVNMNSVVRDDLPDGYVVSEKRRVKFDYRSILNL